MQLSLFLRLQKRVHIIQIFQCYTLGNIDHINENRSVQAPVQILQNCYISHLKRDLYLLHSAQFPLDVCQYGYSCCCTKLFHCTAINNLALSNTRNCERYWNIFTPYENLRVFQCTRERVVLEVGFNIQIIYLCLLITVDSEICGTIHSFNNTLWQSTS